MNKMRSPQQMKRNINKNKKKSYSWRIQCLSKIFSNSRLDQEEDIFPEFENNPLKLLIQRKKEEKKKRKKKCDKDLTRLMRHHVGIQYKHFRSLRRSLLKEIMTENSQFWRGTRLTLKWTSLKHNIIKIWNYNKR